MRYYKTINCNGFTLLEVLITILIISILIAITVPVSKDLINKSKASTQIYSLSSMLYYARSEAIKRRETVIACPSKNQKQCSSNWEDGQLVYIAASNSQTPKTILRVFQEKRPQGKLTFSSSTIQFSPTGKVARGNGTFVYCPEYNNNEYARSLILSKTGRIRTSSTQSDGKPLQC